MTVAQWQQNVMFYSVMIVPGHQGLSAPSRCHPGWGGGGVGGGGEMKMLGRRGGKNFPPSPQGDGGFKGEPNWPADHLEKARQTRKCAKWGPVLLQGGAPTQSRGLAALDPKQTPPPPRPTPTWVLGRPRYSPGPTPKAVATRASPT
jgi:hypothetical protein